ncbi:methyltransferase domain-containing protein [Mariniblastus fucicola]|uniref:Arsenite methyltransferase n=1 Tax=Mariniblastus fucicola TaxID=980251 RepID=A0A5B9P5A4_9BACT|nr:methyltransferase domain-containing protein [Mariniblastus fucicola]QEG20345.1 arsenite S-adenosylmethyltransferase [Mariniblastus fucicola]
MSESSVRERYAVGAQQKEPALCCPVDYDQRYLEIIPDEVIERDYGCGDPSKYVSEGETVLDLGSGTGKICFIASQVVGKSGKVIGVDMTDPMLEVANRNAPIVAERIGYANVEFRKGRIQDLALDLEKLETWLKQQPVEDANGFLALEEKAQQLREAESLIESDSIDVVVSNCVLNLVGNDARKQLFSEIYRVLKTGGRAVISDIVSDEDVPVGMQQDPELWSGCISGAFREDAFLQAFEDAGFHGVEILKLDKQPWQTVEGIEFRSMTVCAYKGDDGPCVEKNQAVIYKGPFKAVVNDDGHPMERGKRYAVCEKTYELLKRPPYCQMFEFVDPHSEVTSDAKLFDCSTIRIREPGETKGSEYSTTIQIGASSCCSPESSGGCC